MLFRKSVERVSAVDHTNPNVLIPIVRGITPNFAGKPTIAWPV